MPRLRKILTYTQTNDADAMKPVIDLAERHDAAMTLCDVISQPPETSGAHPAVARLHQVSWQNAFDNLRSLREKHKNRASIKTTLLVGEPFLAIMEQVALEAYDLVAHISAPEYDRGSRGLNPIGMHLARKCPGLVWCLHPGSNQSPRNIVVAIDRDFSSDNRRSESLVKALVDTANAVIKPGGVMNLVHVWQPYGEALLNDQRLGMSAAETESYISTQQQEYEAWFESLVEQFSARGTDCEIRSHLLRGPVAATINQLAQDVQAELIVMGTIGTSVVPGILIGMSAEALLSSTQVPVLAVKAKDFVTPLELSSTATSLNTL